MLKYVALESDMLGLYAQLWLPLAVCPQGATSPLWASAAQLSEVTAASTARPWENEPKQSWKMWCSVWLIVRAHGLTDSMVTADGGDQDRKPRRAAAEGPTPTPEACRGHADRFSKVGPSWTP